MGMAYAATPIVVFDVVYYTNYALAIGGLVITLLACVHCLLQRPEAFAAIGTFSKGVWMLLTGGSVLAALISLAPDLGILGLIAVTIAAIYLLDVRPALRDAVDGHGPW